MMLALSDFSAISSADSDRLAAEPLVPPLAGGGGAPADDRCLIRTPDDGELGAEAFDGLDGAGTGAVAAASCSARTASCNAWTIAIDIAGMG